MTGVEIRRLGTADAERLVELRRQALCDAPLAFAASREDDLASSLASVRSMLAGRRGAAVFGAALEDRLVGMLGVHRDRHVKTAHKAHLWGFYVRPGHRRRGLGRRLLDAALDHARSLGGITSVRLGVGDAAPEAMALYQRAGFRVWGTEPEALRHEGQMLREHHLWLPLTRS